MPRLINLWQSALLDATVTPVVKTTNAFRREGFSAGLYALFIGSPIHILETAGSTILSTLAEPVAVLYSLYSAPAAALRGRLANEIHKDFTHSVFFMESPQDHYDSIGRHLKTFSSPIPGARQPNRMTTVSGSSYVNTQKELDIPAVLNNYDSDEDDTFQGQKTVQYRGGDQRLLLL